MPNNAYRNLKASRRLWDFPFTHAVSVSVFINAVLLLLTGGLSPYGYGTGYLLAGFAIPATILIILGLQWKGSVIAGHGIEKTGHWLAVGAWLINAWLLGTAGAYLAMPTSILFLTAHVIRARRLRKECESIRYIMQEKANQAVGDGE